MPKPIILIGVPFASQNTIENIVREESIKLRDEYHIIIYSKGDNQLDFRVFYEKDFNEVKFEELKKIVEEAIKK